MKTRWITLTTDFGLEDWFVGTLKGVIAAIAPGAHVVDLTHGIPPGDIQAGAFALSAGFRFFPRDTIHMAIVDPEVGSARAALVVRTENYYFLAPDNGVLSVALGQERILELRRIDNRRFMLPSISQTFHGRDVFAPCAGQLAQGAKLGSFGKLAHTFKKIHLPSPRRQGRKIAGAVVYVDRFGNAITNIHNEGFARSERAADVFLGEKRLTRVHDCYQSVAPGKPVCVPGSTGFLEIAINQGDAARRLKLKVGSVVAVQW